MPGFKPIYLAHNAKGARGNIWELWISDSTRAGYKYCVNTYWGPINFGERKSRIRHTKTYNEVIEYIEEEKERAARDGYTVEIDQIAADSVELVVGDRVQITNTYSNFFGAIGTIVDVTYSVSAVLASIKFDNTLLDMGMPANFTDREFVKLQPNNTEITSVDAPVVSNSTKRRRIVL